MSHRSRLTRRQLCQAGAAGLGSLLLGPALALGQDPHDGLSCEIKAHASNTGLTLELHLINVRSERVRWSEHLHRPTPPNATVRVRGQNHTLTFEDPLRSRNRPQPRMIPRRTVEVPAGTAEKPSRILQGRFVAKWPADIPDALRRDDGLLVHATFQPPLRIPLLHAPGVRPSWTQV